jgi:hypothetical protein
LRPFQRNASRQQRQPAVIAIAQVFTDDFAPDLWRDATGRDANHAGRDLRRPSGAMCIAARHGICKGRRHRAAGSLIAGAGVTFALAVRPSRT